MDKHTTHSAPTRLGYEIIRDHVLPGILGKHEDDILYWAGKDVARKFPIFSVDELPDFFAEAGWGTLTPFPGKTSKDEAVFILNQEDQILLEKDPINLKLDSLPNSSRSSTVYLQSAMVKRFRKKIIFGSK